MAFGGQDKALVLLVTETACQLLLWQKNRLLELAMLVGSADDQELFLAQVRFFPKHPVIIVTDLIDENFRHDTIVHVGGTDREALMKRKLDFAFRNTRYRLGAVVGRQPDGRKDDRILLSALTKPERIDVWARLLLQEKMAVQAVTSTAHLLNAWLPQEKLEGEEHLLISQLDADNNLRQTYAKQGRVLFSRLASLNTVPEARLGIEILQETAQLRQYLERVQFLNYESALRILVLTAKPADSMQTDSYSSDLNRFESIDIRERCANLQIDLQQGQLQPAHYLIASILQRRHIDNQYAPPALTRFDDLRRFGKLLLGSAAAILLAGLGLNVPGVLGVLEKREQAALMQTNTGPLRVQYDLLTQRFPETPAPPREMELVVKTHDTIARQSVSPIDALNLIAQALAISPGLLLLEVDWQLAEVAVDTTPDPYGEMPRPPAPLPNLPSDNELTGLILQERTRILISLKGEAYSPQSYREAQDQVSRFIAALDAHEGVSINSRQMPIDIRSDVSVSTTINDAEVRAPFTVEIAVALPRAGSPAQVTGALP